jgi:hypothetical protein
MTEVNNLAGFVLASGMKLALGNASGPLSYDTDTKVGYRGYADVPIVWRDTDGGDENTANLYSTNGVMTNVNTFKWPDADDETGQSLDGWGTITHLYILDNTKSRTVRYKAAFSQSFSVPDGTRPKFEAGQLRITFSITEVSS